MRSVSQPIPSHSGPQPDTAVASPRLVEPAPGITPRSILLGLALTVAHTCWLIYEELALLHIGVPTYFVLVQTVVGLLFTLMLVNCVLKRLAPRWVLSPVEMMVIFTMTTLGAIITARNLLHYLFPILLLPVFKPELVGGEAILASLPGCCTPRDPELVRRFFIGTQDFWAFFRPEILKPWLLPMAFWGVFFFLLLWTMLCLSSIVRRPWLDQERVPFPIIDLPVMMARENNAGSLFSNRLLVLGFVITSVVLSINYLSSMSPAIPGVQLSEHDIGSEFITAPPWSSVNPLLTVWWPYAIGLCYLIPLDVSFSCWFFFALIRLLVVGFTALGWREQGSAHNLDQFPYFTNAAEGAWLGMFAVIVWNARGFLRQLSGTIRRREKIPAEDTEAISYRAALWGAAIGFVLLVAFGMAMGMRLHVAVLAFALYFIAIVVMTRMYAQVSLPVFCMAFFSFTSWTTTFTGTLGLTRAEASTLTTYYWFDRTHEQLPMAHHLEALVFADRLKQSRGVMFWILLLSIIVGIVVGIPTLLQIFYDRGAASARVSGDSVWLANLAWSRHMDWVSNPRPIQVEAVARTAISAAIVLLLSYARSLWIGFPLHPIGYLFASSFGLEWGMWNVIFVTWLVKALVVRYGGLRLYRASVPFFLGLALGDAVTQFFWGLGLSLAGARGASPY
ncbi:MAG TPA: DUF6785 family protein [Chthonomonadales bacterium]|nr:DUF6785 family protein [Chthonomonadales bacterium]